MRPLSPADAVGGIDKAKAAVLSGGKADGCAPCKQDQQWGRFGFENTPSVHQILRQAAACSGVSQELQDAFNKHATSDVVPWKLLQQACECSQVHQQHSSDSSSPQQQHTQPHSAAAMCAGGKLALPTPPVRHRSEQLQQRLAILQERLDSQRYAAMVADVTHDEQEAAAVREDPFFPTTKLQLSFGLHVIVTMGTFFALGYYGGLILLHSQSWAALCGCLGLVAGLLLETTLLILRVNMPAPLDQKYANLLSSNWDQPLRPQQQQKNKQQKLQKQLPGQHNVVGAAGSTGQHGDGGQGSQQQSLRRRRAA